MDPSQVLKQVLLVGVLPGAAATLALLAAWSIARKDGARWVLPLLIAGGVTWAEAVVQQRMPDVWPRQATDRVPHAAWILAVAAVALGFKGVPTWARLGGQALAMAVALWLVFGALVSVGTWSPMQAVAHLGVMTLIAVVYSALLDRRAMGDRSLELSLACMLLGHGAAVVVLEAAVAHHAQLAGGVTAVLGAALVTGIIVKRFTPVGGGVFIAVGLILLLLGVGRAFGRADGVGWIHLALLGLTPACALAACIPPISRLSRWWRAGIVGLLGGGLSGAAIGLALAAGSANDYPY